MILDITKPIDNKDPSFIKNELGSLNNIDNIFKIYTNELAELKFKLLRNKIKEVLNDPYKLCALFSVLDLFGDNIFIEENDGTYTKVENMKKYYFTIVEKYLSFKMISVLISSNTTFKQCFKKYITKDETFRSMHKFICDTLDEINNIISNKILINIVKYYLDPLLKDQQPNNTITDLYYLTSKHSYILLKKLLLSDTINEIEYESNNGSVKNISTFFDVFFTYIMKFNIFHDSVIRFNRNLLRLYIDNNIINFDSIIINGIFKCNLNNKPTLIIPIIFGYNLYLKLIDDINPLSFYTMMMDNKHYKIESICIDKNEYNNKIIESIRNIDENVDNIKESLDGILIQFKDIDKFIIYDSKQSNNVIYNIILTNLQYIKYLLIKYINTKITKDILNNDYKEDNLIFKPTKIIPEVLCNNIIDNNFSNIFNKNDHLNNMELFMGLGYEVSNKNYISTKLNINGCIVFYIEDNKVINNKLQYTNGFKYEFESLTTPMESGTKNYIVNNYDKYILPKSITDELTNIVQEAIDNNISNIIKFRDNILNCIDSFNNRYNPIYYDGNYNNFLEEIRYIYPELYNYEILNKEVSFEFLKEDIFPYFRKDVIKEIKVGELS